MLCWQSAHEGRLAITSEHTGRQDQTVDWTASGVFVFMDLTRSISSAIKVNQLCDRVQPELNPAV